ADTSSSIRTTNTITTRDPSPTSRSTLQDSFSIFTFQIIRNEIRVGKQNTVRFEAASDTVYCPKRYKHTLGKRRTAKRNRDRRVRAIFVNRAYSRATLPSRGSSTEISSRFRPRRWTRVVLPSARRPHPASKQR